MLQSEIVRHTTEEQLLGQLEKHQVKAQAMRFAHQTNSEAALVQYPDGPQRWTIFREGEPIAAFPVYTGDLAAALTFHDFSKLEMQKPAQLEEEIRAERENRKLRLPHRAQRSDGEVEPNAIDSTAEEYDEDPLSDCIAPAGGRALVPSGRDAASV